MMISQSINKIGFPDSIIKEWIVISRLIRLGLQQKKKNFKNKDQTIVSHGDPDKVSM